MAGTNLLVRTWDLDEYGNYRQDRVWAKEASNLLPGEPIHPPFGPEARDVLRDLYETFRELLPEYTPEVQEHNWRRVFYVTFNVAVRVKMRQVYSTAVRGHWNDLQFKQRIFRQLSLMFIARPHKTANDVPDRDKALAGELYRLWTREPTLEQVHERIRPLFPPDVPITRENCEKFLGRSFDLPDNPGVTK